MIFFKATNKKPRARFGLTERELRNCVEMGVIGAPTIREAAAAATAAGVLLTRAYVRRFHTAKKGGPQ